MKHAEHIIASTQEIFSSMIMLDVTPGEPFKRKNEMLQNSIFFKLLYKLENYGTENICRSNRRRK